MRSLWQETASLPRFPSLKGDLRTEVAIVGGGITGILTAYFLKEKGIPFVLLEKGRLCGGTTQNTTAKLTVQHGLIYASLLSRFGVEGAKGYLSAMEAALGKYKDLARGIDCDLTEKDNFVYATDDRRGLEAEMRALDLIGYPARFSETLPLPIRTVGAVSFPKQAEFHPLKFLSAIAAGLPIYENTHVREIDGRTVVTDTGKVFAERIVIATHFPFLNRRGLFFLKLYQHRSYVLALKNAADVGGMYVDASHTGYSFRNYKELLLLGGGGHRTGKKGGGFSELRELARLHYPDAVECFAWAAQDCMSLDGMPYIGRYSPSTPYLYTASGFNKWGMTGACAAAMLLSSELAGERSEYAELFSPSRSVWRKQLFLNGLETAKNLLTPTSPRCSHLGCALKWNKAEHTWDCACHGSRFTREGKQLENPANKDLK